MKELGKLVRSKAKLFDDNSSKADVYINKIQEVRRFRTLPLPQFFYSLFTIMMTNHINLTYFSDPRLDRW